MNRKQISSILLGIILMMCPLVSSPAEETDVTEDPVVVRVEDISYTRSKVKPVMSTDINLVQLMTGTYLTKEERREQMAQTLERYVDAAIIQLKLREKGKNDFTSEEEETMKSAARNQYEQIWQGIWQRAQESSEKFTEEQVTEFMEDAGYTISAIYEETKAYERRCRAVELYCPGLILTQDMVDEYYAENFLNPDRQRYENDLDRYEEEIIAQKNESFYTPEGYRTIKQILLAYPNEVERALKNERARYNLAANQLGEALQALAAAAAEAENWEDMAESRAAYHAAAEEAQAAAEDYAQKRNQMTAPLIQPTVDAIMEAYESGTDIDTLIKRYSTDSNEQNTTGEGYPFHPESKNWTPEFSAAVSALKKPGDLSQPVYSNLGIHIVYYASDIPGGDHVLTESEREILNASAKAYYEGLELQKLIGEWKKDYEIELHPELMDE